MKASDHTANILQNDISWALTEAIGFKSEIAQMLAAAVFKKLQSRCGGRDIYVPAEATAERNQAIKQAFDGRNHAEVCRTYRISLSTLYRVIRE